MADEGTQREDEIESGDRRVTWNKIETHEFDDTNLWIHGTPHILSLRPLHTHTHTHTNAHTLTPTPM